jgi:LuxR family maltose regulon positive regulatory protein
VFQLDERTEGWAAGLQMAALALASQPNAAVFVKNFSGSHRYILDYLIEEVLSHQPEDIQNFLLETSILKNLSAPLCDSVTGFPSRDGHRSSQQLLGYLEQANLFLIPLDSERTWYRYHHLFADLLRARLDQQAPDLAHDLHSRASCWYEANQRYPEAIDHALAGGKFEHACALIEAQVSYRVTHNGMGLLLGWIHKLPADMALNRPWLCIAQAWSLMFTNESDQSEPLLRAAERNIPPDTPTELQNDLRGQIACLWAGFFANIYDETQRTIEMARQALTYLSLADAVNRTYAKYLLGRMYFLRGDFSQALPILTEIIHDCIQAAATNYLAQTLSLVSKICRLEGRLQDSIDLLQEGCGFIEASDPRRITVSGMAFIGQVDVLREWNRLDEAEDLAKRSLELLLPWENPSSICSCYTWMVRIYIAKGNPAMAEAVLNSAIAAIRGRRPMAGVTSDLNNARVWYWLTTGQVQMASQWALQQKETFSTANTYLICQELDEMILARVLIAEGKPEQAQQLLEPLAAAAERGNRFGRLIEIQILQALAFQLLGDQEQARILLEKSLTLAEPEGYIRSFIDEGEAMRKLLLAYSRIPSSLHKSYAQKLLACLGVPGQPDAPEVHSSNLVEPLTPREIEVLQWMAEGFSNHQIAEKLILAEGTIKYYVHAVLGKLAVRSRTQAIVEAKKLKII